MELTSHLNAQDVDQFEIKRWLRQASDATVVAGRHPMVTPPRVVQLVHAVRRPLSIPRGTLVASRNQGQTFAVLSDPNDPLLNVDTLSTSQVDVAAEWKEYKDNDETAVKERVGSIRVERATRKLPELRHEFGDTRHRRVTYGLTALSCFRQFFHPGPAEAFQTPEAVLAEVRIPSSARPAPPVLLSVTPSFRWQGASASVALDQPVRRQRLGGRLRIELGRPWNTSGEGEQLAVVVWPSPFSAPPSNAVQHLTRFYRDPIWNTQIPPGIARASMFGGTASEPREVAPVEGKHKVLALPYAVKFHEESERWYADIELLQPIINSYCPFVRLAVARYQPDSLPNLHLSSVVATSLVQVMPESDSLRPTRGWWFADFA